MQRLSTRYLGQLRCGALWDERRPGAPRDEASYEENGSNCGPSILSVGTESLTVRPKFRDCALGRNYLDA